MAIDTVLNPVGMAQKLSVQQLQKAIQDGTIPPYVGIPVLQEKISMEQRMRNAAAQPQSGPTIAQRVMQEAQGLDRLQSNLPTQYAGGGIVAFAGGDLVKSMLEDDEDVDQDYIDSITNAMEQMDAMREMMSSMQSSSAPAGRTLETFPVSTTGDGITKTEVSKGFSVKEGDQPAKTVEKREKRVSAPAELEDLLALVEKKESGGKRYDKYGNLIKSPKGALGEMQVMPATAMDPGFGVAPAKSLNDPDELRRVGRDVYAAMLNRYGDPKLAAIAYNWGPGNTDKWLASGADPSRLPGETRQYAQGFAGGGVARYDGGGITDLFNLSAEEVKERARRLMRMSDARAAFSAAPPAAPPVAAPAVPAAAAAPAEGSLLSRAAYGLGNFLGQTVKSPLTRGLGIAALATPSPTGAGEQEELARRQAMPATIDTTERLTPMIPVSPVRPTAPVVTGAGAGRGRQGGPSAADLDTFAREQEMAANQEREDFLMAQAQDILAPKEEKKGKEEMTETPAMKALRERIAGGYEDLKKQRETDKYLALLQAGLGMMSGTSPYAMANIGAGAMKGVEQFSRDAAARAAQEKALMGSELGVERYSQLGALQREQMAMRQQLAEAEAQRKREATQVAAEGRTASLLERQRKTDEDTLSRIEAQAGKLVDASGKLASLEALNKPAEEIARARQKMIDDMLADNKRYQSIYSRLYPGVKESFATPRGGNTISWDQLSK